MLTADIGPMDKDLLVQDGPQIEVMIGFDTKLKNTCPMPALLDTGATYSCIDLELAKRLCLKQTDSRELVGAHEKRVTPFYRADIYIPQLKCAWRDEFGELPLEENGFSCKVLIGRNLLSNLHLRYEGYTGKVLIEFPMQILS